VPFTSFALFLGVAMAITAFPVLARILTDRCLARTELGVVALGCAAIDDVTAWCLLAFIVGIARTLTRQLEHLVTILFLPAFFAFTGMRTRIDLVSGLDQWILCAPIILMATLGKFGGTLVAARLTGLDWRAAAALGTLMNTRGLLELIVLNIGLDLRVISPPLFAMMVVMALVTTMATAPVLQWLLPQRASAPATESTRVIHGGEASPAARAERRQAEGPSAGHQN
jgi:Kef-type K+ transport system membrane component KefB